MIRDPRGSSGDRVTEGVGSRAEKTLQRVTISRDERRLRASRPLRFEDRPRTSPKPRTYVRGFQGDPGRRKRHNL